MCCYLGIICNIGPLEHLRQLARKKINGYNEIYLKKDLSISMKTDVKGIYADNIGKTQIVGIDATFDEPQTPDLVLEVDKMSEEETYQAVLDYVISKYLEYAVNNGIAKKEDKKLISSYEYTKLNESVGVKEYIKHVVNKKI